MIAGDFRGAAIGDPAGLLGEDVPDARAAPVDFRSTLDLRGRGRRAPDEIARKL
jgi:hypothetical protein